jgi:hypothetical protein
MEKYEIDSPIKNAFNYILSVYKETSFLLQDLEKELVNRKFQCINGSATGTSLSYALEKPEYWMSTFLTRFWMPKNDNSPWRGPKTLYLTGSILFAINGKAIEPLFTYGIFQAMDSPEAAYCYDWHLKVIQNEGGFFSYKREGEAFTFDKFPLDRKPIIFECEQLTDRSYTWPKLGVIIPLSLVDIKDSEDISILADEMKKLWDTRNIYL